MTKTPKHNNCWPLLCLQVATICAIVAVGSAAASSQSKQQQKSKQISLRMPDIRPDFAEQYLCMSTRVPVDVGSQFIVGFNPKADASRVHHMLVYGCQIPGIFQRDSPNFVWDCSGMHSSSALASGDTSSGQSQEERSYESGPICEGKQQILYGWALDAPKLKLPEGVGFEIGGLQTGINFLVLQVHYGHIHAFLKQPDLTDNSGLILDIQTSDKRKQIDIKRRAGVLLLISLGYVVPGNSRHEIACKIQDDIEIHPFRFRVHTHRMGVKVLGAKLSQNKQTSSGYKIDGGQIIGIEDPQRPQMFYQVREKNMTLSKGDTVYGSCEFNNNKTHAVNIGATGDDEMCNFYLMYWTESDKLLSNSECFSRNPPSYSAFNFRNLLL